MQNQRQESYKNVNAIELKSAKSKKDIVTNGPRRYINHPAQFDQDLRGPSNDSSDSFDKPGGMGFFNPEGSEDKVREPSDSPEPLFKEKNKKVKKQKDSDNTYGIINI